MKNNQSLLDIIEQLPDSTRQLIMETTDVSYLNKLKKAHKNNINVATVIDARIENLTYLAT